MYIPEFWRGVLATLTVEVVALVIAAIRTAAKRKKQEVDNHGILEV